MAADINHVILVGRLTRDAELKSIASGQAVCKFSIAVNRSKKNGEQWEDEPNFFDVVLWGRRGEALHQYLNKGKLVGIDGELRQDRWQQDGQNRSKVEIVANNIQLLGGGGSSGGGGSFGGGGSSGGGSPSFGGGNNSHAQQQGQNGNAPADDGFADDIPF